MRLALIKVLYCYSLDVSFPGFEELWQVLPLIMLDSFKINLCAFVFGMLAPGLETFCLGILLVEELDCPMLHTLLLYPLQSLCNSFEISSHIYLPQLLKAIPKLTFSFYLSLHLLWFTEYKGHDVSFLPFNLPLPFILLLNFLILKL